MAKAAEETALLPTTSVKTVYSTLREQIDPERIYSPTHLSAALKCLGLEAKDIDPEQTGAGITVNALVPKEKQQGIKQQRSDIWEGLRQQRLREVQRVLDSQDADAVRRYDMVTTGGGVRPLRPSDLPPAHALAGMSDFKEKMQQKKAASLAEQERKAAMLATNFLTEKKRLVEADFQLARVEQRLHEYKKERADTFKARRIEADKKNERREAGAKRAQEEREQWEAEMETKLKEKIKEGRKRREERYNMDIMKEKAVAAQEKRDEAYRSSVEKETKMTDNLEAKREMLEERLAISRKQAAEELALRAERSQIVNEENQVRVHAALQVWAEKKLEKHNKFKDNYDAVRLAGKMKLKEKSKSTGDITRKAHDKAKSTYDRLQADLSKQSLDGFNEKHEGARLRQEEKAALRIKCENDIHSFREVRDNTWHELTRKRQIENENARDAYTQSLVFKIGENMAAAAAKRAAQSAVDRRRQRIEQETLIQTDRALEGFKQIQSEGDEKKITEVMTSLGFKMPKLPGEEEENAD
eukprot:TRINITY_DN22915_c0_g4_i1.p1 TRINITY_DN22915_c0_g4~~TRINITY_DN22915_c0_g4_i1.p1  ORF type:complete len:528 (-),score=134.37 TRINITY_DN22915_c0_g4_i1:72-1655(-)